MEPAGPHSGNVEKILGVARQFFQRIRIVHGVLAVFILATGSAATALSEGSDGSSKIPYYFSAYISGFWHIFLVVVCQVALHYLSGDTDRVPNAGFWVTVYSVVCSIFVIFNVMGMVFVIVNGLCVHNQQCYYDKNHAANRALAILLILQTVICNLLCILFAKRAHAIDVELGSDITIKLGHYLNVFRERVRSRHRPGASSDSCSSSISTLGSCSSLHKNGAKGTDNKGEPSEIDREKIIASVMAKRKLEQEHRSKSHPNLHRHHHDMHAEPKIEGTVFSIYSDSETISSVDSKRKRRYTRQKQNAVKPAPVTSENSSKISPESSPGSDQIPMGLTGRSEDSGVSVDDDMWSSSSTSTFRQRPDLAHIGSNITSAQNSDIASDITETDSGIVKYKKQLELQQHRDELRQQMLDKQRALLEKHNFLSNSPPPPYEDIPPLPNMVLNIKPAKQDLEDDATYDDNESQSTV